jgi:hypothetical protein
VRVPELRSSTPLAITRCSQQRYGEVLLDNAFSLIEGTRHSDLNPTPGSFLLDLE